MDPIPLPALVHYEVALKLLEQQTVFALGHHSHQRQLSQELIVTLRKALSQQKRLEESCKQVGLAIDYRWSIDRHHPPEATNTEA